MPVLLVIVAFFGCASSALKNQEKDVAIHYKAVTRGRSVEVTVNKDSVLASDSRAGLKASTAINKQDWEKILQLLNKVKLDGMQGLEAPSSKRMYDGALSAALEVTVKDKAYRSNGFDHGNPPAEIAPLVAELLNLAGIKE